MQPHQEPIQSRQIDDWTQIPCLLQHQEQLAVEPKRRLFQNSLYGSLGQQGIDGLLEILAAVPGAERDAVMGELRSINKSQAHPLLDSAGGPAGPQQALPLVGKACQASSHLQLINVGLNSVQQNANYLGPTDKYVFSHFFLLSCLRKLLPGMATGSVRGLTTVHGRGENQCDKQMEAADCAGAAAH